MLNIVIIQVCIARRTVKLKVKINLYFSLFFQGNIILTDFEYTVLQLLRTRTDNDKDVKFAVREKYPHELAKQHEGVPTSDKFVVFFFTSFLF